MNEDEKWTGQDRIENLQEIPLAAKKPRGGPGYINLAIPDRGHSPSCVVQEFANAGELNAFAAAHPNWLTIGMWTTSTTIVCVFQELQDELTQEENAAANQAAEEAKAKFIKERDERKAAIEAEEAKEKERAEGLRLIGRLCVEKHGAFVGDLPELSKVKGVRKNIADDILKLFNDAYGGDAKAEEAWVNALNKILAKYVKDGVK